MFQFKPGITGPKQAEALNELERAKETMQRLMARQNFTGEATQETFPVKVTASDGGSPAAYSWIEQFYTPAGIPENKTGGRSGSPSNMPAYESNGQAANTFPFFAVLRRRVLVNGTPVYEFDFIAAAAGIEVLGRTGDITAVTKLTVGNAVLTGTSTNAVLTPDQTSHTLEGIVNLVADQWLGANRKLVDALGIASRAAFFDNGAIGGLPAGLSVSNLAETGAASLKWRFGSTIEFLDSAETYAWRESNAGAGSLAFQLVNVATGAPISGGAAIWDSTIGDLNAAGGGSTTVVVSTGEIWAATRFSVGSSSGGVYSNRYQGVTTSDNSFRGGILVTSSIGVAAGGTGAASLTAHGILLGQGTGPIVPTAAMTDGQMLVGQTGADPLPKTISGAFTLSAAGAATLGNVDLGAW